MKNRLFAVLSLALVTIQPAVAAEAPTTPVTVTTLTRSAVKIGTGSFALAKGTRLEVLGREGDQLIVKFHAKDGRIPAADTDLKAETPLPEIAPAAAPAAPVATKPATAPVPPTPVAKPVPPALATDGKPTSTYGKTVQKAKQAAEANKSTHVDPTKGIMDDEAPKK